MHSSEVISNKIQNQYLQAFCPTHPKNNDKIKKKNAERDFFIDFQKGIFQEISKADQMFHFKLKVSVFVLQDILAHPRPPI